MSYYDHSELKRRIIKKYRNIHEFSNAVNMPIEDIEARLNNQVDFSLEDITVFAKVLQIQDNKIVSFFYNRVQKN